MWPWVSLSFVESPDLRTQYYRSGGLADCDQMRKHWWTCMMLKRANNAAAAAEWQERERAMAHKNPETVLVPRSEGDRPDGVLGEAWHHVPTAGS